ncbi:transposable element Tcb1 transposase [Trichonephila clavipes]|nr:transposable element Tcb1 transposase [Trichonephila clavipes]
MSPIEHMWDHLGRRVGHATSLNDELEARLQQIWNEMSQDIIQNVYALLPYRIASWMDARNGSTGSGSRTFADSLNWTYSQIRKKKTRVSSTFIPLPVAGSFSNPGSRKPNFMRGCETKYPLVADPIRFL